jgi:hypothetical protein
LLVYVPIIIFILFLLIRFRHYVRFKRMVVVSVFVVTAHLLLVSSFANRWGDWWGGASFGPRYLADLVPWFSALAIVGLDGMLHWRRQHAAPRSTQWKLMWATGAVLLALSVMINARGALSQETWRWTQPINDRQMRALLWDWRHPQFLAGLQRPAPLVDVPLVGPGSRVEFDTPEAEKFLWYGWSGAEEGFRWSDGKEAAIVFGLNHVEELTLNLRASVFTGGKPAKPTVGMALNGNPLPVIEFNSSAVETYQIGLPKSLLAGQHVLTISMPDAATPRSAGLGDDDRLLGIKVYSIEFQRGDE